MTEKEKRAFLNGYFCCCENLIMKQDEPTILSELLGASGMDKDQLRNKTLSSCLDLTDKKEMMAIIREME